jgi:two-component system chemotaxis sensor kinase CheA
MDEIKQFFLEEANELFDSAQAILSEAEQSGVLDGSAMDALFRDVHTLKGGSGSVGLDYFAKYTHTLETFMDSLRNGELASNEAIIEFLIESLDEMMDLVREEAEDAIDDDDFNEKFKILKTKIDVFQNTSSVERDHEDDEKSSLSEKNKERSRVLIEEVSGEFIDLYDTIVDALESTGESADFTADFIARLFRYVHTLKGSSVFMGLDFFPKYMHEIESFLDDVREGKYQYNLRLNNFLLEEFNDILDIAEKEFTDALEMDEYEALYSGLQQRISTFIKTLEKGNGEVAEESAVSFELFDDGASADDSFVVFDDTSDMANIPSKDATPEFEVFDSVTSTPKEFEVFDSLPSKSKIVSENKYDTGKAFDVFDEDMFAPQQEDFGFSVLSQAKKELDSKKPAFEVFESAKNLTVEKEKESPKAAAKVEKKKDGISKTVSGSSIRVGLEKIDFLMNRVGDLVITKSMLFEFATEVAEKLEDNSILEKFSRLDREIRELQESVMSVRMVPMESIYSRLPKIIRDLKKKLNKKVDFVHYGDTVEIDKMMMEGLMDPLTHILRNSLDHGIEEPEARKKLGKKETGTISIAAAQESGHIIVSIEDDGAGINIEKVVAKALQNKVVTDEEVKRMSDEDKAMLIFSAGLSTAEQVSAVSGRGVGMDVVMNNINALGGTVKIQTVQSHGTKFFIILPLTLAILDGLNILIGEQKMIMPLNMIVESLQPAEGMIKRVGDDNQEILMLRNEFIPIIRLYQFFNIDPYYENLSDGMLIIARVANTKVALFVDDFLNQEQIVVKSLEKNYKKVRGVSATTIRGDGSIGLIIDIMNIVEEERLRLWS